MASNKKLTLSYIISILLTSTIAGCGGGGGSDSDNTTPPPVVVPPDTTPTTFTFVDVQNAALSTQLLSNTITVSGINAAASITINNGEYAINNSVFTTASGEVNNGDTVVVRVTSSAQYETAVNSILTIGGVSDTYTITTTIDNTPPPAEVQVDFNVNTRHVVGGKDTFDRQKYITIHASHTENDWYSVGENESDDLITDFMDGYDVYFGRDTGGMAWQLGLLPESSTPGYADPITATTNGNNARWNYSNSTTERAQKTRQHEDRNTSMVVAAQQHPYWPDGKLTKGGWAFSQTDTVDEPFGTATGDFMGQFIAKYFNKNDGVDTLGQPKPKYIEVMNEPLYDLVDVTETPTTVEKVFEFHNAVADAIRNVEVDGYKPNANALIGGYTVAFPDFDKYNFDQWLDRDKKFIDIAGDNMDFFSIHLYDFPIIGGKAKYRSGSNMEATLDMLATYGKHKYNAPKPLVISEYGAQIHDMFNQPWSAERDWYLLKGMNSMLMQFLERPDEIEVAIPFVVVKAEWGRLSSTVPYYHRLMRQQKEGVGETGEKWVYGEIVKFYQLWAEVNGTRIESASSDLDIQADAYIDGDTGYFILDNLEFDDKTVALNMFGSDKAIVNVEIKELLKVNGEPSLRETSVTKLPTEWLLADESTVIFKVTYASDLTIDETATETRYYSPYKLAEIQANTTINLDINNVTINENDNGAATLRLGISRAHGLSLTPTVTLNDQPLIVPQDYRGYDQYHNGKGRDNFYGVIEVPVDMKDLAKNNRISVTFPDGGGYLVSNILQVLNSSQALGRSQ